MINLQNVTKEYGENKGVNNFTYRFEEGNVYGLIGPNGAGKTTLIKLITNFIYKDAGTIEKNFDRNERLYNISYMPDFNTFVPGTVKRNIEFFNLTYRDINLEKIYSILSKFEIELTDKVIKLSTGKRKALSFALCVSRDVKVYIFDEPFSGIDVITRKMIVEDIINEIDLENSLVIISSHELHDMDQILDHVILINRASLIKSISVDEIKENNESLYEWFLENAK